MKVLLLAVTLVLSCTAVFGQTQFVFLDDFESGMGNWTTAPPPLQGYLSPMPMELSDTINAYPASGSHSAYMNHQWAKIYHNLGHELSGSFRASWYMYDGSHELAFGEIRDYSGSGCGDYLNQDLNGLLAAGKFGSATRYRGRYSGGWFDLDGPDAPLRSPGWHLFEIERLPDHTLNWYVDGRLSKTLTGVAPLSFDSVFLGYGVWHTGPLTIPNSGQTWFDGVSIVGTVPEPSSILAILCGLGGLGCIVRRRS